MSALTNATPTLAELAAAQKSHPVFAFSLGEEGRLLNRMRAIHAKKVAQLDAYADLVAETSPDLILRAADGREVVLRLPGDEIGRLYYPIRDVLEREIRELEGKIISEALQQQTDGPDSQHADLRPAILALCQPAATVAEQLPLPAAA